MRYPFQIAASIVLMLTITGCPRETQETPGDVVTTQAERTGDAPLAPERGELWLDDYTLGSTLSPQGRIPIGATDDDFLTGEPIYLAMEVGDAPAGAAVRVVWIDPVGRAVGEESKIVAPGDDYMQFLAPAIYVAQPGEYRVQIYAGNDLVQTLDFSVSTPEIPG